MMSESSFVFDSGALAHVWGWWWVTLLAVGCAARMVFVSPLAPDFLVAAGSFLAFGFDTTGTFDSFAGGVPVLTSSGSGDVSSSFCVV